MVALAPWVELPQWEIAVGMLIMHGGFGAVMIGMLYKIVPFLVAAPQQPGLPRTADEPDHP